MSSRLPAVLTRYVLTVPFLMTAILPMRAFAEGEQGIVLGRVFEVDKEKYERERARADAEDELRLEEYLEPRSDVAVIARLLESNQEFRSEETGGGGDYLISNLSPGVFEFKLRFEDRDYPVAQRLDAKVNLTFLAELCFVLDEEEQVAWMVAAGPRRSPDVPAWVPDECQSQLSACLGLITDEEDFRKGLLLIFAGSGAAATGIGIAATRDDPASPLERP